MLDCCSQLLVWDINIITAVMPVTSRISKTEREDNNRIINFTPKEDTNISRKIRKEVMLFCSSILAKTNMDILIYFLIDQLIYSTKEVLHQSIFFSHFKIMFSKDLFQINF